MDADIAVTGSLSTNAISKIYRNRIFGQVVNPEQNTAGQNTLMQDDKIECIE